MILGSWFSHFGGFGPVLAGLDVFLGMWWLAGDSEREVLVLGLV
jgi:hypothetical protein